MLNAVARLRFRVSTITVGSRTPTIHYCNRSHRRLVYSAGQNPLAWLEGQAQAQLRLAHRTGCRDPAKIRARILAGSACRQIHQVKSVRGFEAELQALALGDAKLPSDAQIDVLQAGPIDDIPPRVAVRPVGGLGEGRGVEPSVYHLTPRSIGIQE